MDFTPRTRLRCEQNQHQNAINQIKLFVITFQIVVHFKHHKTEQNETIDQE